MQPFPIKSQEMNRNYLTHILNILHICNSNDLSRSCLLDAANVYIVEMTTPTFNFIYVDIFKHLFSACIPFALMEYNGQIASHILYGIFITGYFGMNDEIDTPPSRCLMLLPEIKYTCMKYILHTYIHTYAWCVLIRD